MEQKVTQPENVSNIDLFEQVNEKLIIARNDRVKLLEKANAINIELYENETLITNISNGLFAMKYTVELELEEEKRSTENYNK